MDALGLGTAPAGPNWHYSGVPTNFDASVRTAAESWRSLRHRRAEPPVPPGSPQRAKTFQSALEPAEQQFRAASSIGYDSRALNLFYGVSQAGRALAAASPILGNNDWRLLGHGLQLVDPARAGKDFPLISAKKCGGAGSSFVRLSTILKSDQADTITIGEAWRCIWEAAQIAPLEPSYYIPLLVYLHHGHVPGGIDGPPFGAQTAEPELPQRLRDLPPGERPKLAEYLQRYPALRGWLTEWPTGHAVDWPSGQTSMLLAWPVLDGQTIGHAIDGQLVRYRNHNVAVPALPGHSEPIHPLMAWWTVLYILSMLTRYHPDLWTDLIDVNKSTDATQLEFLLDTAISAVPDLVDEAIAELAR